MNEERDLFKEATILVSLIYAERCLRDACGIAKECQLSPTFLDMLERCRVHIYDISLQACEIVHAPVPIGGEQDKTE